MSIYDEMEKDFQNAGKPPQKAGLFNSSAMADPSVEDMENEMAQMGYQRTNDNDSWGTVLSRIPLMAAGNTISNIGRFMAYGGKPDWMTDEEYDIWNKLPAEDRKNLTAQDWVNAYRSGDPEAPRPIEGATGPWSHEINKGIMEYGEKLARENTGNYTPYTAKSFAQGVGGLLPSIAEMALMKRTGMFSPTPLQEAGATMMGTKAGNLVSKIPINAITRNADKVGLFTTNLAKNAMLSQVEAVPESLLEQNDAVQDYIERAKYNGTYVPGKTEQEAMEVGRKVYSDNILLNTVGDSIQNALMDQIGQGNGSARSKLIKGMLLNAPVGGFTEGMQGIIPKNAAGEEWNFTDPDIGEAALIGAVTGGAPGAINIGLDYAQGKYADRQVAKNIRNMGEGQELTDEEKQFSNDVLNMGGNDGNPPKTPPATPGTLEAVEEMQRNSGTPSFEYTRDSRWVKNNDSVSVDNLQDITKAGIGDISTAFMELTGNPMIITSGTDGAGALHMDGTYSHGTGYKIDVSGNGLEDPEIRHAFIEYCESKGITVLDEYEHPSPNSTGGHLDLEFHGYNGAGSVDDYSGPVNQVMPDIEAEPAASAEAGMMASDLTGQSFLDNEEEQLFPVEQEQQKNLAVDNIEPADNEELARRAAGDIPYEAEPIPVNRSNVSYPQYQQRQSQANTTENAPHITSKYNPKYLNNLQQQVKTVSTAELTQTARQFANFPEQHPARRIVMNELGNRINAANRQSRDIGNEQQAPTYPQPVQQEQQSEKTGKAAQATPPPNPYLRQLANGYDGDMDALRQDVTIAKTRNREDLQQGKITQQQAQEREAKLNDYFFRLQPMVQNRRQEKAIAQAAKDAGIKQQDLPRLLDTARGARKGDPADLKKFNGYLPKIRKTLDDILDGNVGRNIASTVQQDTATPAPLQNAQNTTTMPQNNIPTGNVPNSNAPTVQAERANTATQNTAPMQQANNIPSANASANNTSAGQTATNSIINSQERNNGNGKTQLQKSETGENRNQNQNTESGQTTEQKGDNGKAGKNQGENIEGRKPEETKQKPPANETREEKAERLINEAFEDEDERDMAMSCFFDNMENPLQALEKKRKEKQEQLDTLVQNAYEALARTLPKDKNGKPTGAGVDLIRKADDTGYIRDSKNPLWYRNDYADGVKTPYSKKNMMNTALEMVLGERKDMVDQEALMEYDATNKQLEEMFNDNRQLYDEIEILNSIEPKLKSIQDELNGKQGKADKNKKAPAKAEDKKRVRPYRNENGEWVTSKGERIQFAEGYKTESGKDVNNADSKDFIVKPDGTKEFGKITDAISKVVKEKYGEDLKPGNIRLRVGNANEGLIHAKEHEKQAKDAGYSSIEDLISDVASNFTEIYQRTNNDGRTTYNLVKTGDKSKNIMNGIAPVYFELQKEEAGNYYIVITALPKGDKSLEREIKNEHLIYRSPGLDAATISNDGAVSTQGNSNVGVTQGSFPTSDSSVPTNNISQEAQERKGEEKESAADDNQQAKTDALTEKMPEPETENIIQPEEVPETMRKNSTAPQAKIEDFGEKIGGARKDMYINLEPGEKKTKAKSEKKADDGLKDRPWLRDYDIKQGEDGKWILTHKPSEEARKRANTVSSWIIGIYGQPKKRPVETKTYDTREEAEHHAAIDALSEKHRVFKRSNGEFEISRRIGGQKDYHWFALKTGFKTEKEALTYMALHPVEVLQIRTSFGEADLPKPNIKGWNDARTGKAPQRLKAEQNATADMFTNTFGFRGVQFGNWENQIERQSVMNAAYEGLLDLADIIGVDPKIISLNGELGLAFGARGQGLSGAVAHYEPRYTIINLTKMKGAGALAHEWLHALDHYLMIKGGIISNERRADGLLLAKNFNEHASDSDFQLKRSSLSDALKQAFLKVKNTAFYKEVVETKDETDALKWEQQARDRLDKELSDIRNYLAKERKYSSKKSPATEEQLKRFDELATKLAAADEKREWDGNYMMHVYPTMRKLSDLFKEITGRGLLKKNPGDDYKRLNYAISNLQVRRETLADAQAKTEFTKRVPSEYSRNNTTIDRGRSTEYWTKPTEMLARAFSSFVEDSAKAKGYTTDFLSYGSDNRLLLFGKPFPEGEERKAINQAFRDFFKVVQKEIAQTKKETGEIKFSVRAAAKEQPADNTRFQAAYHGSPHVFDTFSLEHVGSGEGHQVHGYGLYFAEEKSVADEYRYRLTADKEGSVNIGNVKYVPKDVWENLWIVDGKYEYLDDVQNEALQLIANYNGDVDKTISFVNDVLKKQPDVKNDKDAQQYYRDLLKYIKKHKSEFSIPSGSQGQLYEVDIPEKDVLLDEQKTFDEQPEKVKAGIKRLLEDYKKNNETYADQLAGRGLSGDELKNAKGRAIYLRLSGLFLEDAVTSQKLNEYGIKGITYWGNKDGRCFVVFDDKAIEIMQRYEAAVKAHGTEIQRSVDSIITEVKDAYPGAKDLKVKGNDITFTMPNGVNLTVHIKDQIILDGRDEAKARKSHRLTDENTGIVVEGYVRKLDNESMMVLSQESSEGTAYHEAFHTVRDWCLTEKENADLEKYYGKKAKEQGIDVEEAIADGYRDWKLARAKGSGTLFGKLYKKMSDFIDTVRAIFKGMYDVHRIYEQIESGDVWNRDANGRFTQNSNSVNGNFKPISVIIKEAKELYNTAAKKFSGITDKAVSERVKEAIQQTLDFGDGEGEILERASGKPIQQSLFGEDAQTGTLDMRGNTGRIQGKQIGFSLTRKLINEGFADLTGKTVNNAEELAEIAQVLRHPGYEKLHYVYVKGGKVVYHETTTTMLPNVSNALIENEDIDDYNKRLTDNIKKTDPDMCYLIHNHPSGNPQPSGADFAITDYFAQPLNRYGMFGGHIILDTDKCCIIRSDGTTYEHDIPENAQIHYDGKPDVPHILLNTKVNSSEALMDISKKLADQSEITAFFVDVKLKIRGIVQLPSEFAKLSKKQMNEQLREMTRQNYSAHVFITTGNRESYTAMLPLYHQGAGVVDIFLTGARQTAGRSLIRKNKFNGYNFFGIDGETEPAKKVLEPTTEYNTEGTRKGASSMPENNIRYSIRQKATEAVNKLAKPEEKHYGNDTTGIGKVTQQVASRQETTKLGEIIDALRDTYRSLVDEDTHAHKVEEAIQKRTGKELSEDEKFYNGVRLAGNIAKGHAEWLIAGDKGHGETVKSRIKKDALKKQFNSEATLKNVLDTVEDEKMNGKYGDFLKKHNMRDWTQVLETHLAAWRLKEMFNLHMQEWREEHAKWRAERDAAKARGEAFRKKEPRYEPYKLPGNLTVQDLDAAIKAAPAEVEKAAQLYYAFNKNLTILLADAGLISGDNFKLLNSKYQRYCPLMRDFSDTAAADDFITGLTRGGDGPTNVSNPLKRISKEGSHRGLLSPLESTIKACAIYCDRAERNKVGQNAVALAEKHKLDDMIWRAEGKTAADAKNCIFTVMQDGKKVAYQCIPELYEPIVGCSEDGANMVLNLMSIPARCLRTGATISPTFAIRNMIRDTIFAGIASKNGFVPIYDTIRGFMTLRNDPEMRAKFEAMGVGMYTFYGSEMAANKKLGDLKVKEPETLVAWVKELLNNVIHLRPVGAAKTIWHGMEAFSELSEQSTRMGEFQRALANGKSLEEAARDARNLTIDFSRHGRYGKYVNQVVPFFNACVQGGDLMVRLMHNDPVGTTAKYIVLPSIALWAMNHDDDWWKEMDPDLKNSSWFIKTPAGIVRIPKPQEAGVLFGSGAEAILDQASKRDPEAMKNWAQAFVDAIKPNVVPTVFLPILENMANFSYFRMKPIVSRKNENKPGEQQYSNGTSELSKMLGGSALAHAYNKGGYSPSKIDNFIRGYTGTMGMLLWQGAGEAVNKVRGIEKQSPEKKWNEMPFAREFFVNSYSLNRSLNEFYDMAAAAETYHNGYGKKGKPSAAVVSVRKARSLISDARKDIQKITDSKTLSPERKRELIDKRQEKINRIAKIALEKYRDKF